MEWFVQKKQLGSEMARLGAQRDQIEGVPVTDAAESDDVIADRALPDLNVTFSDLP